jgi:DNA-directed RNA polymerase subunit F
MDEIKKQASYLNTDTHFATIDKEKSDKLTEELLKEYSVFLEKYGYLDTDWREEKPTAVKRFMEANNL